MRTLDDCRKDVDEVESGKCPSRFRDRDEACKALIHEICSNRWQTAAEQERAQGLVARLERLQRSGSG